MSSFEPHAPLRFPTSDPAMESGGIVASARRLTDRDIDSRNEAAKGGASSKTKDWQVEAWELLELIGEYRFLTHTLAGRMSQAAFYVGRLEADDSPGTRPQHVEDETLQNLLSSIGDGVSGQSQLVHRAGVNLFVTGECWLVGIPPRIVPGTPEYEAEQIRKQGNMMRLVDRGAPQGIDDPDNPDDVLSLVWRMLSISEINVDAAGLAKISLEDGSQIEATPDDLYLIRIWRPHPRQAWEADSPTKASLPVLRELLGLTQHISAQIDSRLAGAGLLAVSDEVDKALKRAAGLDESDPRSPLMEGLTLAMQTAVKDRSSASALVPLAVTVPGEPSKAFHHISFSTPFDKESPKLRDEAIRRLALGLDAPPELLLGVGGMNHWGAWLVREDVVNTHLEPPLSLICDALTTQFLRPLMLALGYSEEEAREYVVWYDVDHLVARPNRSQDAKDLHERGAISDEALREANGFEDGDAPEPLSTEQQVRSYVRGLVEKNPALADVPGIPALLVTARELFDEGPLPETAESTVAPKNEVSTEGGTPSTGDDPPPAGTPGNPGGGLD